MSRLDKEYNVLVSMGYKGSIDDMRYKYRRDFPQQYNTRWDFLESENYPGTIDDKEYLFWKDSAPTVNFLFAEDTELDPRVYFTRGSEATGWVNGQLETFGINEPRFVTDPVTGESLGLLVEGQATNLLTNSEVVVDQTIIVPSGDITLSFYGEGEISFTGAATGSLQGIGGNARAAITVTAEAGALVLSVTDGSPSLGQLEEGTRPTSYIPTEDSQATRAADDVVIPVGDWFNPNGGTFVVEFVAPEPTFFNTIIGMGRAANEEFRVGYGNSDITNFRITTRAGGGQENTSALLLSPGQRYRAAATYAVSGAGAAYALWVDGSLVGTRGVDRLPSGFAENGVAIGARRPNANELNWNGTVASIAYYPRALSNEQLQALTS